MNDVVLIVLFALVFAASCAAAIASWLVLRRFGRPAEASRDLLDKLLLIEAGVQSQPSHLREELRTVRETADGRDALLRKELTDGQVAAANAVERSTKAFSDFQRERLDAMAAQLKELKEAAAADQTQARTLLTEQLEKVRADGETRQKEVRDTLINQLDALRKENEAKLEQMRVTVDEKLQGTLEARLGESFKMVSERLDTVHKGLGEMQLLATGVGDLKRVLTNVKSRGSWGEVQLGSLLEDMLTPDQFGRQVKVRPDSADVVDFAVHLPGSSEKGQVLLPLDCKFPHEDYDRLLAAQDSADPALVESAAKGLERAIRVQAKSISEKYVHPPHTTPFAIMYLPTEGLFAEVVRRPGLAQELSSVHSITVTGPTTLAALLNSLKMGFQTLAIQKNASDIMQVLGEAKKAFGDYGAALDAVDKKLDEAKKKVADVGIRHRAVSRKLRSVETLEAPAGAKLLSALPLLEEDEAT